MQLGPPPWSIAAFIDQVSGISVEDFKKLVGPWALVGVAPEGDGEQWNFRTLSARTVRDAMPSGGIVLLRDNFIVVPVKKATDARSFQDTLLMGRATSNDVCVRHLSVSKLHARIRRRDGRLEISDAGSSNGTQVNGSRVDVGDWVFLQSGDTVSLGSCAFHVLEASHLHRLLKRFGGGVR